jgi:hypothetical protein
MPYDQPYPDFAWSHSRDRTLVECARRYYYQYYGAHRGWMRYADEDTKLAYRLKNLTTLYLVLGLTVHKLARECVERVVQREPMIPFEGMVGRMRAELNHVCLASYHRSAFIEFPARSPMLRDVWYNGRRNERTDNMIREKLRTCAWALSKSPLWDELRQCKPEDILVVDSLSRFLYKGTYVFAAPDLVYRPEGEGSPRTVIVDWKTGGSEEDDAMLQLSLYALMVRTYMGIPFQEGSWQGRIVYLHRDRDEVWYDISAADIQLAEQRIQESIAAMRGYMADVEQNQPLPKVAFPILPPHRRSSCYNCNFFQLCHSELTATEWQVSELQAGGSSQKEPVAMEAPVGSGTDQAANEREGIDISRTGTLPIISASIQAAKRLRESAAAEAAGGDDNTAGASHTPVSGPGRS